MAKFVFEGLTLEQAKEFAHWYEGQGEQDACVWFNINEVPTPITKMGKGWMKVDGDTVTIQCQKKPDEVPED